MGNELAKTRLAAVIPLFREPFDAARLFLRASQLDAKRETWPDAERLYREVVRISPKHVEAWNNLGVMAFHLNRFGEALDAWSKALQLDPDRAETHNNIGHLFQLEGKLQVACSYLERAVKHDPEMGEARVNLALALQGLGRTKTALRHWRAYLERWPEGESAEFARKHAALCLQVERR